MRTHQIDELIFYHNGAGGEGIQTFDIPLPRETRSLSFSTSIAGANNAISNILDLRNNFNITGKAWGDQIIGNIFTFVISPSNNSGTLLIATASKLRWKVQSNAVTANNFYVLIKLFDR